MIVGTLWNCLGTRGYIMGMFSNALDFNDCNFQTSTKVLVLLTILLLVCQMSVNFSAACFPCTILSRRLPTEGVD